MTTADGPGGGAIVGSPPTKQALVSWWQQFTRKSKIGEKDVKNDKDQPQGIFGIPLQQSIQYANVAISLTDANGQSFIYGYVPIVVAKCGVFLKEKATDVEGIFRLNGSAKRIKDLQTIFNSPDKYGKGLDWTGYTVHDAANVLRRYLNQLPEPIIPLNFYGKFRQPLTVPNFDPREAIRVYQKLINELPHLNRQLLLYILDLLAVFASKSEQNLMTSHNLSAIFQPGLISHPDHDMSPEDYRLSQDVLVFLIENQDHFLLGMGGQADPQDIAPQTPTTPRRSRTVVSRSPSNSSAAADDVRRNGGIRRNASVSSRVSAPASPQIGVSRRNTLPTRRSPSSRPNSFRPSGPSTPTFSPTHHKGVENDKAPNGGHMTENVTPTIAKTHHLPPPEIDQKPAPRDFSYKLLEPPSIQASPPATPRNFANLFSLQGTGEHGRQPNRLKKRRIPGSTNPSAESSTTSLPSHNPPNAPPSHLMPSQAPQLETVTQSPAQNSVSSTTENVNPRNNHDNHVSQAHPQPSSARDTQTTLADPHQPQQIPPSTNASSATLMPSLSPTHSATSSAASRESDPEFQGDVSKSPPSEAKNKMKNLWRRSTPGGPKPPTERPFSPPGPTSPPSSPPAMVTSPRRANGHDSHHRDSSSIRREPSRDTERRSSEGGNSVSTNYLSGGEEGNGNGNTKPKGALGWLQRRMGGSRYHDALPGEPTPINTQTYQAYQPYNPNIHKEPISTQNQDGSILSTKPVSPMGSKNNSVTTFESMGVGIPGGLGGPPVKDKPELFGIRVGHHHQQSHKHNVTQSQHGSQSSLSIHSPLQQQQRTNSLGGVDPGKSPITIPSPTHQLAPAPGALKRRDEFRVSEDAPEAGIGRGR